MRGKRRVVTGILVLVIFSTVSTLLLSQSHIVQIPVNLGFNAFRNILNRDDDPRGAPQDQVVAPTINYAPSDNGPGTPSVPLTYPLTLDLYTPHPDATIYYTLDGSDPTESSTEYVGQFQLDNTTLVKARAYATGDDPSNITTITFYIEIPENQAPVAQGKSVSTLEDTTVSIALEYIDPDGPGPFTVSIVDQPQYGTLDVTGTYVEYTPDPEVTAPETDSFTWRVNDGITFSSPASVTINVVSSLASNAVVIDHTAVDTLWDDLIADSAAVTGASQVSFYFRHASVGENIWRALSCLGTITGRPNSCTTGFARSGTHGGASNSATLELTGDPATFGGSNAYDYFVGATVENVTDGSSGLVTSATPTSLTATLTGGTDNDWDTNDQFSIYYTYYGNTDYYDAMFADYDATFWWHNGLLVTQDPLGGQNPPWWNKASYFIVGHPTNDPDNGVRDIELDGDPLDDYDVYAYKQGYVDGDNNSTIASNFFNPNSSNTDISDMEDLDADLATAGSDAVIALWTMGVSKIIGTAVSDSYNEQLRNYALANDRLLVDLADITSHRPDGSPCYYLNPFDGQLHESICSNYNTEAAGGHLNGIGGRRVAKAVWIMLACVDGWEECPVVESSTNNAPNSSFNADFTSGNAPLTVNFNGTGSTDSDGTIATYRWYFDDGSTQTGSTVSHEFTEPGTYTVTLTVIDDDGAQDAAYTTITVLDDGNEVPIPSFTIDNTSGDVPLTVNVNASASSDPDGTIASYTWVWDDGTANGSGAITSHQYTDPGSYYLSLTVTDNDGSSSTQSVNVVVNDPASNLPPTASFTADPTSGNEPLTVDVDATNSTDSDGTIASYSWNWGDGTATGSGVTASHQYTTPGVYTIILTVTDDDTATDTETTNITVNVVSTGGGGGDPGNMTPTAIISASQYFVSTSTLSLGRNHSYDPDGTYTQGWDIDNDGLYGTEDTPAESTANSVNLNVSGYTPGTYTVGLKITDNEGATDTTTFTFGIGATSAEHNFYPSVGLLIYDVAYPIVPVTSAVRYGELVDGAVTIGFAHNPYASDINQLEGNDPWTGNSTPTADGSTCQGAAADCVILYEWDFEGDGTYDWSGYTAPARTLEFTEAGVYTPRLRVTDNDGNIVTTEATLYIYDPNGGGNATPVPSFTATPTTGLDPLEVDVDATASTDSDGTIASYDWEWGDGSPDGSGVTASHTYNDPGVYALTLTVTDDDAATETFTRTIYVTDVNVPPDAAFSADPTSGNPPVTVDVDASASTDSDGTIVSYSWDWGDGTPDGSGEITSHEYTAVGNYLITLTVVDDDGAVDYATTNISVTNVAPVASFTADPTSGEYPIEVDVDASASSDSDGTIASYSWDWDDGSPDGSGAITSHEYTSAGVFTITLTVTDDDGGTDTHTIDITVTAPNQAPVASFTADPTSGDYPLEVDVNASASSDSDGTIVSYSWDWGDGSPDGSGVTASHEYSTDGVFTITLTVTDNDSATDTDTEDITVTVPVPNDPPTASFTLSSVLGNAPLLVNVNGSASTDSDGTIASYSWNWGDGTSNGSGVSTSHTYTTYGRYELTLTVTDNDGANDQYTRWLNVCSTLSVTSSRFNHVINSTLITRDIDASTVVECGPMQVL